MEAEDMTHYLGRGWTAKFPEQFTKDEQEPTIIKRTLEKAGVIFEKIKFLKASSSRTRGSRR